MRPAVDIDATAPEGPVALEIVADRLPWLDAASALLGIALIPRSS
ncbi:MAG TPA: hypothetical protein VFT36_00660 [Methylomirabilota bacterium]|nr:hypothetical protein [Methylomirabilota bacterium]